MKRLTFVAMALAALSGCTNQTPEEARANLERDYLESCRVWGVNFQAHEMGGAKKYKDRSLLALYDAQKKVARTPDLEALDCNGAFEEGVIEGRRRVNAGQIEMGGR